MSGNQFSGPGRGRKPRSKGDGGKFGRGASKGISKQISWRLDPVILERVQKVYDLVCRGYTHTQIQAEMEMPASSVSADKKRAMTLISEATAEGLAQRQNQHIANLEYAKVEAWKAFEAAADMSLNRSAYLSTVRQIEMDIAKLDGSLAERVEHTGAGGGPIQVQAVPPWLTPEFLASMNEILDGADGGAGPAAVHELLALPPATDELDDLEDQEDLSEDEDEDLEEAPHKEDYAPSPPLVVLQAPGPVPDYIQKARIEVFLDDHMIKRLRLIEISTGAHVGPKFGRIETLQGWASDKGYQIVEDTDGGNGSPS